MFQVVLLFQEYGFVIVCKPNHIHVVANAIFRLLDTIKLINVLDQTIDVALLHLQPIGPKEIKNIYRQDKCLVS
jgi:hypothetical protein